MTPLAIEPATFRFVAQHLNHCATAVPASKGQMGFNLAFKGLMHFTPHQYFSGDEIKEYEVSEACDTYWGRREMDT